MIQKKTENSKTKVFSCGDQMDKQHLNLSDFAYETIQGDILAFRSSGWSAAVNRIFSNFYAAADASVSLTLQRKRNDWLETLAFLPNREDAVTCLCIAEKKRLKDEALSYPKGRSIKVRLNNENYNYLTDPNGGCQEAEHYKRGTRDCAGMYIKAVLEEYARKMFLEREEIYFKDELETISSAISLQKQLKVTTQTGAQFFVRPHSVVRSTYHYLVGISQPVDSDEESNAVFSFRISRMQRVMMYKDRSGFIKNAKKAEISRLIIEKGAAFVGTGMEIVRVRLTEQGKQMYQNIQHLRPTPISRSDGDTCVYTFECTPAQIRFYFLQFGEHAQILSPSYLAEEFHRFYEAAAAKTAEQS